MLLHDGDERLEDLADCLKKLRFVGIALADRIIHALYIGILEFHK
jgi:hypothetical protein